MFAYPAVVMALAMRVAHPRPSPKHFQALGVAGTATGTTATPTGQILTTLIAAFGGLGGIAKIDRVVQMLGLIAARPPASS